MAPSDDLSIILEKIADGNHTDADLTALRQLLRTGDRRIRQHHTNRLLLQANC